MRPWIKDLFSGISYRNTLSDVAAGADWDDDMIESEYTYCMTEEFPGSKKSFQSVCNTGFLNNATSLSVI